MAVNRGLRIGGGAGRAHRLSKVLVAVSAAWAPLSGAVAQTPPEAQSAPSAATQESDSAMSADAAAPAEAKAGAATQNSGAQTVAEAGSSTQLPEIIITSTRRAEAMSKVPISVSAFSEESLDLRGAKDITDVVRFTPGIKIDEDGTNNISIRGISSSAGASTTGIYIDDTPIQMRQLGFNADDALPKVFDLDRVEVLRGPQGTLFGAGAEGGAVRYIMQQPNMSSDDLYTRSEVSFTQQGSLSYESGVAGGTPIIDNVLGFRGSVWFRHDGGWIDRVNPYDPNQVVAPKTNYTNTAAVRLAAKWAVNEDVAITPSLLYQDRVANDVSTYWPVLSNPSDNSYLSGWPLGRREPDRYFLPAIKVESELGSATLVSNTSYYTRYELTGYDGTTYNLGYYQTLYDPSNPTLGYQLPTSYFPFITGSGLNPNFPANIQAYRANGQVTNQQQTFAQEVRLQSDDPKASLVWTTGLFFSKTSQSSTEEIQDPMINDFFETVFGVPYTSVFTLAPDYTSPAYLLPNGDAYYNFNHTEDMQVAIFGEATFAVTDKLKATAGLRVSRTDVSFLNYAAGPQNFGVTGGPGWEHEKPVTPKLSVSYQADRDNMFYATYAKGFRAGGADAPIPFAPCAQDFANLGMSSAPTQYQSDSTKSYEIGAKNKIGDRFRIASSLYYIDWENIQQNIYLPTCGFQFTANSGAAVSKGGDVQIEYAATSNLSFELAVGNTNARFSENAGTAAHLIAVQGDAVEGAALGAAPPWTAALGVQYEFLAMDHHSFVRLDYEYEGHSGVPTPSEDPRTAQYDPYNYTARANEFVSLRAGTKVDKWNVSAFIDNLFDSHPSKLDSSDPNSTIYQFTPPIVTPSSLVSAYTYRPRTFGVTLIYHLH
jgi:outer membrane receptor protein involved in Fe transport